MIAKIHCSYCLQWRSKTVKKLSDVQVFSKAIMIPMDHAIAGISQFLQRYIVCLALWNGNVTCCKATFVIPVNTSTIHIIVFLLVSVYRIRCCPFNPCMEQDSSSTIEHGLPYSGFYLRGPKFCKVLTSSQILILKQLFSFSIS